MSAVFAGILVGLVVLVVITIAFVALTAAAKYELFMDRIFERWHRTKPTWFQPTKGISETPEQPGVLIAVGEVGEATSSLRPIGKARFGERSLDVVAEAGMVSPGTVVVVVACDGTRIVVRPDDGETG